MQLSAVAALVAVGIAAVGPASPGIRAAEARPAPVLRLVDRSPLVLVGAHFRSRERVTVTVRAPGVYVRKVITRNDGSFTVSFGTVKAARCGGLRADAVGAAGDKDALWIPRRACIEPPSTA